MLKIVFFGTPDFAARILEYLISQGVEIGAVVSQPDRPKGRSLQMAPTPVKLVAERQGIPVFQPEKSSNIEFLEKLGELRADLYVVVAFGQILPQKLLSIPRLGCINVHASLLPKYRGAAPIQRCVLNGDRETGVAIQKMVRELDAGDVIASAKMEVGEEMTYGELEGALCELSKGLLLSVLAMYKRGIPAGAAQDIAQVTFAPKVSPEEAEIKWERDAEEVKNLIRGFNPKPGAWCWIEWNGERKRLKIFRAKVGLEESKGLVVPCGRGSLEIIEVQMEGKPRMRAGDWLRGARMAPKFLN